MKRFSLAVVLLVVSNVALADECTTWGCLSTVEDLYTNAEGKIFVSTPLDETLANCSVYSGSFFVLNPARQNSREIYSTLLAAYMSNSKVLLRIVEGSSDCELAYVKLRKTF